MLMSRESILRVIGTRMSENPIAQLGRLLGLVERLMMLVLSLESLSDVFLHIPCVRLAGGIYEHVRMPLGLLGWLAIHAEGTWRLGGRGIEKATGCH